MDDLPSEILCVIASVDEPTYYGMLSYPRFARMIDPSTRLDFMIHFGHTIKITSIDLTWKRNGKYHRIDGPAVEYITGTKMWYRNNKRHRADGPAIEWSDGDKEWYQNDKCHRIDRPAMEQSNEYKTWWLSSYYHGNVPDDSKTGAKR